MSGQVSRTEKSYPMAIPDTPQDEEIYGRRLEIARTMTFEDMQASMRTTHDIRQHVLGNKVS
jgi:hypothetical protein